MPARNNEDVRQPRSWLGAVDVGYLTEVERDAILNVLQRDEQIRANDQERIKKLKAELRDVKKKGAKATDHSYSTRVCARCNDKMGLIFNTPTQCPVCKHKVCQNCVIAGAFGQGLKCVVCHHESKLKAETGEWFFGLMRPELQSLQDGSTLVKQAVLVKPVHFDKRNSPSLQQPEIVYTPATSTSRTSSRKASSINSYGTGSSTESTKLTNISKREGLGPAETGSIMALRRDIIRKRTMSSEPDSGQASPQMNRKSNSLPRSLPPRSPHHSAKMADVATLLLANHKKQRAMELQRSKVQGSTENVNNQLFPPLPNNRDSEEDRGSECSLDSRGIDWAFEEYLQQQKDHAQSSDDTKNSWSRYVQNDEGNTNISEDEDRLAYTEEAEDTIHHLPSPQVSTLPRNVNKKLIKQNRLSASVPTVYQPTLKPLTTRNQETMSHHGYDQGNEEFQLAMNRDMSLSVPNLSQSNTSLNSVGLHDLTITGEIKFSIGYNYKANVLLVTIAQCRKIATADKKRKRSDSYVKCYLLPDQKHKQKTDVKRRTINPIFNKVLKFSVSHSELSTRTLELSVWHAGTFTRNVFLGEVLVPLDTWDWDSKNENWFPLRQRGALSMGMASGAVYKGDILLALKYVPGESPSPSRQTGCFGELLILVKAAKNLTPSRSSGTVDSFVKIFMQPNKQFRQKTSVISKTTSPEWNYNTRLELLQPMEDSGIQLTVCHKDKLKGSTILGGCRLNLGPEGGNLKWMDASGAEKALWKSALDFPFQWVDYSIQLRPSV